MAEGLFTPFGFKSPDELRASISQRYKDIEKARYEKAAQNFAQAGSHAGRMGALGQQLGMTLRDLFTGPSEVDWEKHPEVAQAEFRQNTLQNVDMNNYEQVSIAATEAQKQGDTEFGVRLADRARRLKMEQERMDLEREKMRATSGKAKWKYKNFTEGDRTAYSNQLDKVDYIEDISDEGNRDKAKTALVQQAESLWNYRREMGDMTYTKAEAVNDAKNFGAGYFVSDWWEDDFAVDKFNRDFAKAYEIGRSGAPVRDKDKKNKPKPKVVKKGERRSTDEGTFIFIGNTGDDPNDKNNWKEIKPVKVERDEATRKADDAMWDI